MINIWDYNDCKEIRITCIDNQVLQGQIVSIDDEDESGFGEDGISIIMNNGAYVGIPQSEISSIDIIE